MAKGKAKKINNKPKFYKIYNKENNTYLSIIGKNPRVVWVSLRYLADIFTALKLETIQERFSDIDFNKYEFIEITEEEILLDENTFFKKGGKDI